MKKVHLLVSFLLLVFAQRASAQHGVDGIEVEKYYVSAAADTVGADSMGYLPVGSVTYRIYADLYEEHRFQALYGVPEHDLKIQTSTRFYNTAKGDGKMANDINPLTFKNNPLLMLDSWISVGAASLDYMALPKIQDRDTVPSLAINDAGLLQSKDAALGIPLTERDGMTNLRLQSTPSFFKLENEIEKEFLYSKREEADGIIHTLDGAWACYGGGIGLHPQNKVLIAQLTTDGVLSFELNMQIAIPDGSSRRFVARNPAADEFTVPSLIYTSSPDNKPPVLSLRSVAAKRTPVAGDMLEFKAEVSDSDGKVMIVDFYVNDRLVYTSSKAPFIFKTKFTGEVFRVSATAHDDKGARTRSSDLRIGESVVRVN